MNCRLLNRTVQDVDGSSSLTPLFYNILTLIRKDCSFRILSSFDETMLPSDVVNLYEMPLLLTYI